MAVQENGGRRAPSCAARMETRPPAGLRVTAAGESTEAGAKGRGMGVELLVIWYSRVWQNCRGVAWGFGGCWNLAGVTPGRLRLEGETACRDRDQTLIFGSVPRTGGHLELGEMPRAIG